MAGATIRDVARLAEVSVASVSRALNGLANVHPDTRARVLAAAKELGYVPHAGARSLSLARTNAIGVVLPDLHGEFFSELVRGLDREASARGYHLLLSNIHADRDHAAKALRTMRGRVDGLVVLAPYADPVATADLLPASLPTVMINTPSAHGGVSLRIDNRAGAEAMAHHLVAIGRQRIVHVTGPVGNTDAQERLDGFRAALPEDIELIVVPGDFTEPSGEAAVARLQDDGVAYDAIFAGNDLMAVGALRALRQAGRAVPQDVAVCGFDDVPLAGYLSLTTIRVHMTAVGARAAARLIDALEGCDAGAADEWITPELVVRGTTVTES
ncbi:LacI family DNA-binding transcriptional regulator [Sphingomonas sp.]|jgi:LacI family transcriptional regulator|uniref:LacI family DNA-binding transcriptional regulator n=1 Tax=Sphingomonas sp. TaxID=28214 RepID=UPI002622FDD5|nr:LacI family DNA-binding transcriptional regulator [Sphingomonas sp.]MDF2495470.1 LacI family transcriptional regulator [Sphingomonas sp.]